MAGIQIGLKDIHYAVLTSDSKSGVVYSAPKPLAPAIKASIKPNSKSSTLYADDIAIAQNNSLGSVEVELEVSEVPTSVLNDLLGVSKNADGVLDFNEDAQAPYVALLFRSKLSNGGYRYVALTKGVFALPEDTFETKGEDISFQTKSISGTFITREFDNTWKYQVDDNDPSVSQSVIDDWFTGVYAPTVTP